MADELDQLTLARARRGDPAALAQLVRFYQRPVYALVSRLLLGRGHLSVDDMAQESFVRVIRGIHRFEPEGTARLSTWILTVATRACLNGLRARRREEPLSLSIHGERPDTAASPEEITLDRERQGRVERAMAALSEDMRAVLVLRAFHDLDYPEIAAALEVEVGTVKSRLSRARTALREALDQPEEPRIPSLAQRWPRPDRAPVGRQEKEQVS